MVDDLAMMTEHDLKKLFEPFGDIEYIDLFKKSTGENKGYAFICYKESRDAKAAVLRMENFRIKG
jgi:RNA-binding protein 39